MGGPIFLLYMFVMLGVLAFVGVLLVHAVVVAVTVPRRMPAEAQCDRCRYPIAGLSGWVCPECGADLRQDGVTTARLEMRRRGRGWVAMVAWTILVWFVGGYSGAFLAAATYRTRAPQAGAASQGASEAWIGFVIVGVIVALWIAGMIFIPLRRRALRRRYGLDDAGTGPAAPALTPG